MTVHRGKRKGRAPSPFRGLTYSSSRGKGTKRKDGKPRPKPTKEK